MKRAQFISRSLRQIDYLYNRNLSRELSSIQVNHHYEVLLILAKHQQPITQNELAGLLHVDKSRMANIIFYLTEKQLVTIKRNPADKRQHYVFLSADARLYIPFIETKIEQINELAEAGISEEKLNIFFEVSEAIRQNLVSQGDALIQIAPNG
ncbi:MarR family winged helix-turn-helix transcriptional regulator [Mucilaginibacter sp. FT3.2]|uniref:MarR family winged helix-turn-helix transcriptional regulator n=1 Tax=Mucilaginibacter sp. FT3.2 TaxID=2723090 RepID=UPI00161FC5F9|nr:MarR family transcriptional regulator [Mucilaginibacter sp. FT3.2]MBB6231512.1 DNA-binding MarR family transcriptional regulator [Mucilaginibacter sp. FT3.2]